MGRERKKSTNNKNVNVMLPLSYQLCILANCTPRDLEFIAIASQTKQKVVNGSKYTAERGGMSKHSWAFYSYFRLLIVKSMLITSYYIIVLWYST